MSDKTGIEWADATWNPVWGCTPVSPGCDHCYAETLVNGRLAHLHSGGFAKVTLRPEQLDKPLRWKRPRRIFVNSMSDLFHDDIPNDYIARVFAVMLLAEQHTFQVLTKRHGRMRSLLRNIGFKAMVWAAIEDLDVQVTGYAHNVIDAPWPLPNVWLGVSVENQQWADIRIPAVLETPAAVRFISAEPLLGPVCLDAFHSSDGHAPGTDLPCELWPPGIDWVIVGGESGKDARPMHPEWARSLREQCQAAGVPFLFKQWGEWAPSYQLRSERAIPPGPRVRAERVVETDHGVIRLHKVGKHDAGRELDGRTWDEYPQVVAT